MKKKFIFTLAAALAVTALLAAGCSNNRSIANNSKEVNTPSVTSKNTKNVNDSEIINSSGQDSSAQLDSIDDDQLQELNSDELDTLLNDNNDLSSIPSSFSVK